MIDIAKLKKSDIGRWVIYCGNDGETEIGRLKSWNNKYIFVVYRDRFEDSTGMATRSLDLNFINEFKNEEKNG